MNRVLAGTLFITLGIAAAAGATPIGPVYPPPTGVSYTPPATSPGRDPGGQAYYNITDFSLVDQLWWGLDGVTGPLLSPLTGSGTGQTLSYSGTTAEGAIYTSATPWTIDLAAGGTVTEQVRLVMNIYDYAGATNLTSQLVSRSSVGVSGSDVLFPVTQDFSVLFQFQAWNGSSWDSILDQFDALHTSGSCTFCVQSGTNGGFWYTEAVPEPGSMALFGCGLLGIASRVRRRLSAPR